MCDTNTRPQTTTRHSCLKTCQLTVSLVYVFSIHFCVGCCLASSVVSQQQDTMPVGIEAWITQIPPITRGWLALSVLISLAVVSIRCYLGQWIIDNIYWHQQCQIITPLQLYFSWKSAFVNAQVCHWKFQEFREATYHHLAMACCNNLLLLRVDIARLCLPPLLFVRLSSRDLATTYRLNMTIACVTAGCWKNLLSRIRKQIISGFSFFLLLCSWYVVYKLSVTETAT